MAAEKQRKRKAKAKRKVKRSKKKVEKDSDDDLLSSDDDLSLSSGIGTGDSDDLSSGSVSDDYLSSNGSKGSDGGGITTRGKSRGTKRKMPKDMQKSPKNKRQKK